MTRANVKHAAAAAPGIAVSILPKLACPACWPAYAGLLSAAGLGFLISATYLLVLTVVFFAIAGFALAFRASRRRGYGPFCVGLLAAAVILVGKFHFDVEAATYAGVGLLVVASVWNSWPRHAAAVPSCCVPAGGGHVFKETYTEKRVMKHKIEIFSAGCNICQDTIATVSQLAGSDHEIVVQDMHQEAAASRAAQHGIKSVPAVVIDGKLAACCAGRGVEESTLRRALR